MTDPQDTSQNGIKPKHVIIGVVCGVLSLIFILMFSKDWSLQSHPLVGNDVPEIEYEMSNGKKSSLKNEKGIVLLVNFWASWCLPCMEELPDLRALENHFRNQGLLVLAFNVEDNLGGDVKAKFSGNKMPSNLIFNFSKQRTKMFDVDTLPLSVIIDKKGKVRNVYKGPRSWMVLDSLREIEKLIKE